MHRLVSGKLFAFEIKALLESVNTSACIDELLLACEERMALGANIYAHVGLC